MEAVKPRRQSLIASKIVAPKDFVECLALYAKPVASEHSFIGKNPPKGIADYRTWRQFHHRAENKTAALPITVNQPVPIPSAEPVVNLERRTISAPCREFIRALPYKKEFQLRPSSLSISTSNDLASRPRIPRPTFAIPVPFHESVAGRRLFRPSVTVEEYRTRRKLTPPIESAEETEIPPSIGEYVEPEVSEPNRSLNCLSHSAPPSPVLSICATEEDWEKLPDTINWSDIDSADEADLLRSPENSPVSAGIIPPGIVDSLEVAAPRTKRIRTEAEKIARAKNRKLKQNENRGCSKSTKRNKKKRATKRERKQELKVQRGRSRLVRHAEVHWPAELKMKGSGPNN